MPPKKDKKEKGGGKKVEEGPQVEIKQYDNIEDEDMEKTRLIIKEACAELKLEKDICAKIKKDMDAAYPNTTWNVISGNHFAVCVTHATLVFALVDKTMSILVFKKQTFEGMFMPIF